MLLRIVILEDSVNDAELILRHLQREGFELQSERVETREDFLAALSLAPDLVLADYTLPSFSGLEAIRRLKELQVDIPVILISGTIGEEVAVEAMREGAYDYLLKNNLTRLGPSVRNALEDKRLRAENLAAQQALAASEARFRALIEKSADGVVLVSSEGTVKYESPTAARIFGLAAHELIGRNLFEFLHPDDVEAATLLFRSLLETSGKSLIGIYRFHHADGSWRWIEATSSNLLSDPNVEAIVVNYRDVSSRMEAERALGAARARLAGVLNTAAEAIITVDEDQRITLFNQGAEEITGYHASEVLGRPIATLLPGQFNGVQRQHISGFQSGPKTSHRISEQREIFGRRKDGSEFPAEATISSLEQDGKTILIVIMRDITKRKQSEEALRASEERYRLLFESNPMPMWVYDTTSLVFLAVNDAAIEHYGYTRDEFLNMTIEDIRPPEEIPLLRANLAETSQMRQRSGSWKHRKKDGTLIDVEIISYDVSFLEKSARLVLANDITERKQAERALQQSEEKYRKLAEQIPVVVYIDLANGPGNTVYISPGVEKMLGYSPRMWLEKPDFCAEIIHPEDRERVFNEGANAEVRERFSLDYRYIAADGRIVWVRDEAVLIRDEGGQPRFWQGVLVDITERKQIEEKLRLSDQILQNVKALVLVSDSDGRVIYASPSTQEVLGYSSEELLGEGWWELTRVDPEEAEKSREFVRHISRGEIPLSSEPYERRIRTRSGETRWIMWQDALGPNKTLIGVGHDVTEYKQAQISLEKAEARYRVLIEQLPMIVYIDLVGDVYTTTYVSPQIESVLGYTPQEWKAEPEFWKNTLHPEDRQAMLQHSEASLSSGVPFDLEYRMIARDGHVVWVHDRAILIRDADGNPLFWQGMMVDITERKQAEETLRKQDEKLQQRNAELTRLYRASEALLSGALVDLPSLAQRIVHTVLREFQQSNCSLLLINKETRELERLAVEGPYALQVSKARLRLDKPGLVAKAIRLAQVINVPDVTAEPDYAPNWEAARSELVMPLKVGDEVIGALDVQSPESDAFHEDDERLMTIFSERAALALERSRLHEQTKRQLEQLEGLRTIDLAISNSLDLHISLSIVLEQVVLQLGVDAAAVLLMKPGLNRLEYLVGRGFRTRAIESTSLRLGEGYAGRAALEKQILHIQDFSTESKDFTRRELLLHEEFVSYFGVPLIAKGEVKGLLEIFHRKPLQPDMAWLNFLDSLGWQTAIAVDNALLFEGIQRSNLELAMAYDATIEGWSRALDLRDKETEGHTQRVTEKTMQLARAMGFSDADRVHIRRGALLHDIGKMGVPDPILLKPAPLSADEWVIMKQHPTFAYEMLQPIAYLKDALNIPYCHHEKWDGSGYPRGLVGAQIPLEARLFAIVDVWDAITSDRPYRKKWTKRKALKYIRDQKGKHFDPDVVEIFLKEIIGERS